MMRSSGNRPSSIGSQHTRAIQKSSRSDEIEAAIPEQSDLALEVHINRATTLMDLNTAFIARKIFSDQEVFLPLKRSLRPKRTGSSASVRLPESRVRQKASCQVHSSLPFTTSPVDLSTRLTTTAPGVVTQPLDAANLSCRFLIQSFTPSKLALMAGRAKWTSVIGRVMWSRNSWKDGMIFLGT